MVTKLHLREELLHLINTNTGINGVNLVLRVMGKLGPTSFEHETFQEIIEELVKEGEVTELEYILPQMDYRMKSMYFPKGTKFPKFQ